MTDSPEKQERHLKASPANALESGRGEFDPNFQVAADAGCEPYILFVDETFNTDRTSENTYYRLTGLVATRESVAALEDAVAGLMHVAKQPPYNVVVDELHASRICGRKEGWNRVTRGVALDFYHHCVHTLAQACVDHEVIGLSVETDENVRGITAKSKDRVHQKLLEHLIRCAGSAIMPYLGIITRVEADTHLANIAVSEKFPRMKLRVPTIFGTHLEFGHVMQWQNIDSKESCGVQAADMLGHALGRFYNVKLGDDARLKEALSPLEQYLEINKKKNPSRSVPPNGDHAKLPLGSS